MPESLKNIILVMSSSGYLVPPTEDPAHEKLWTETWKRIDRFLPDLRKELDLDSKEPPPAPATVEAVVNEPVVESKEKENVEQKVEKEEKA